MVYLQDRLHMCTNLCSYPGLGNPNIFVFHLFSCLVCAERKTNHAKQLTKKKKKETQYDFFWSILHSQVWLSVIEEHFWSLLLYSFSQLIEGFG